MDRKYLAYFPQDWENTVKAKLQAKMITALEKTDKEKAAPCRAEEGKWASCGPGYWTDGLWGGLMWHMYLLTNDNAFREEAIRTEVTLSNVMPNFTHDLGFLFLPTAGVHYRLEGDEKKWKDESYKTLQHAATLLAGRFNLAGGYIRVWDSKWMIVDSTMNLPLLMWASRQTGDPLYRMIAEKHLDTVLTHIVRPDGSCNHIVEYDMFSGEVKAYPGGQGCGEGSAWSRGQAWALYGLTLAYMQTGNETYRDAAVRVANFFIASSCKDWIPDCDFRSNDKTEYYKDNIAGACAACALLELADVLPEDRQEAYRYAGCQMILAMDRCCADWSNQTLGILTMCSTAYHERKYKHTRWVMGDYFFVEAIHKVLGDPLQFWMPDLQVDKVPFTEHP